ncbi:glycine cleavage system aminomethyltransferase GcvT [Microvirga sp. W0021]|uniref:aminomethyltransferase n=1 Tax=Hohaiivirga grylli TaxID=3133970 RepID=A0ABV0BKP0_9HYPH
MSESNSDTPILKTPLYAEHVALSARMVPFAGYDMPVQYPTGILNEHLWTRESAGLFDVSHMGQAELIGSDHATVAKALETLVPADILNIKPGQQRYSQFLNEQGSILDDLMISRPVEPEADGKLILVVNAGCKEADYKHLAQKLPAGITLKRRDDLALFALQGPKAEEVLGTFAPEAKEMGFMSVRSFKVAGFDCTVSRSGYTGEDGYEISVSADHAGALWNKILSNPVVKPVGLGARDSLRLEAGLCLYGHDIDTGTSPIEAGLNWSIQKRRREEGGFPGYERIAKELTDGTSKIRVGILPEGRAPAREGTIITDTDGNEIGVVTSGGFGPSLNGPLAMGYVASGFKQVDTPVILVVRGKPVPAKIAAMPFVPNHYKR